MPAGLALASFLVRSSLVRSSFVAALALLGCTPSSTSTATIEAPAASPLPAAAAAPAARSRWRVGTTGDYAPFSTRAADGQPRGFDIELAGAMAEDLNVELEWVSVRWPTLTASINAGELDIAMTGVTWQPARGVLGYLTRAVARGGPCVLGDAKGGPVAVNRGGVLEAYARSRWPEAQLITVDDNQSLPVLLTDGRAKAIVTDSFELRAFAKPEWPAQCEPRITRKVYWVAPGHEELAQAVDGWLATHGERVQAAQERWFGERQPLRPLDHLSDLLARRLAFMPLVAGAKAKAGLPIEDLAREREVLEASLKSAQHLGLVEARVRDFFALQIELAKVVQRRKSEETPLDLAGQLRPALSGLGDRILDAVAAAVRAGELRTATLADLETMAPWLEEAERRRLLEVMRGLGG